VNKYVEFGKIVDTHGLKGEIVVDCLFKNVEHFLAFGVFIKDEEEFKPLNIRKNGVKKDGIILKIADVESFEVARTWVKKIIFSPREALEMLDDGNSDTYFVADLIGLKVLIEGYEEAYGMVADVVDFGGGPLLEVNLASEHPKNKGKSSLVEYHQKNPHTVKEVDLKKSHIIFKNNLGDL
jgi:16S rRNA processing protein RimM